MSKTNALSAVAAVAMIALGSSVASASPLARASRDSHRPPDPSEFEARAESLFAYPKHYDKAIGLLLKAAGTREVGDPVRVQDLVLASRLAHYREDQDRSLRFMRQAADEAAATGDVITAAHAYMDAAFLALDGGTKEIVEGLIRKAELLAYSPLIGDKDRNGILARIRPTQ
jgi:hypothetical protein